MTDYTPTAAQCCGKCDWFEVQWKWAGACEYEPTGTLPDSLQNRPFMRDDDGTTCPCFKPRTET